MIDSKNLNIPTHVGIIMDGNGRWAQNRGMPRLKGHSEGVKAMKEIVRTSSELGISYLTVYAFSTENWKRSTDEVNGLFSLMIKYIKKEILELKKNNVLVRLIGKKEGIPKDALASLEGAIDQTKDNTGLVFNVAINYGGRDELLNAFKSLSNNNIDVSNLTEDDITKNLYTKDSPDPDLIIRTGGEKRLSNFLMWQSAYSEFVFVDTLWPDFTPEEYIKSLEEYSNRNRRFGNA